MTLEALVSSLAHDVLVFLFMMSLYMFF